MAFGRKKLVGAPYKPDNSGTIIGACFVGFFLLVVFAAFTQTKKEAQFACAFNKGSLIVRKHTLAPHKEIERGVFFSHEISVPPQRQFGLRSGVGSALVNVTNEDYEKYKIGDRYTCKEINGCKFVRRWKK